MSRERNDRQDDFKKVFSNLRLLTFLFIFFIFLVSVTTVLVIASQTRDQIIDQARSEVQSIATIAALQIDGDILATLKSGDENDRSFLAIRDQLDAIRHANNNIRHIYTMRKAGSDLEFIVDGEYGLSRDAALPGQVYPNQYPALLQGFVKPSSDPGFVSDAWGASLSGYAPIMNSYGDVVGIVGVDMDENTVVDRFNYLYRVFFIIGIISFLAAVVGIIVIERRRSVDEELMLSNRNYLTQIFESVRAGILIIDAKSLTIVDANPSALAMIGESKENIVGKDGHLFIAAAGPGNSPSDPGLSVNDSEEVLVTAQGAHIPIIRYAVPLVLEGRPCLLETFVDITDRKKAEDNLVNAIAKLKILSVVTRNDIITDIYALEGYIELIRDDLPAMQAHPLSGKIDWVMERIRIKSAFFKDYDESGTKEPVWQDVSSAVRAAEERLSTRRLVVTSESGSLEIFSDPLLEKVFFNLFDNTLRHGVHATDARISHHLSGTSLVLTYEDNGAGIPDEDKERIFERGVGSLTGLGLFFAREVLGLTGITIRECGEPGTGARFEISVPEGKYRLK